MADYLMIFLVTDIIFLALVVLLIWRDWSMPTPSIWDLYLRRASS